MNFFESVQIKLAYRHEGLKDEEGEDALDEKVLKRVENQSRDPEVPESDAAQTQQLHHAALK